MVALFGIADNIRTWSFADIAVAVVVVLILMGIVFIVSKACDLPIPPWVFKILGLCLLGIVAIFAIRFVASM